MNEKENVLHQFGKNAGKYVTSHGHAKGADLAILTEIVKGQSGEQALDIATGGGHVANAIAPFYETVTALDLTPKMLEKAKEFIEGNGYQNVNFVQGDAESLPFSDEHFHTVTCRIAPHHFPNVNLFIQEAHRVTMAGGLFILIDNVAPEQDEYDQFYNMVEKKRDPSHYRALKKTEWMAKLEKEGFRIESMMTFEKTFMFDQWWDMMGLPLKEKEKLNQDMISASKEMMKQFSIKLKNERVQSFQGESALFVARKK
ncbi:class I SAM-dependent methyltransferase [Metabacillus iocasae]|uniref:Ubiquinone/menaquinone biosynthesis C-methylase UbiE n=1 Tax=Priestia iocasae TaxID=2291674 RepID=A0ABS2QSZ6_9BACI|nr:class I SAM-dependent methyltransferase [Metabacillus iocasae]MBM7702087.1 ubiquinone/menaquinone biosynthesis C-methylase UbiE [Metabacillus iocasae]